MRQHSRQNTTKARNEQTNGKGTLTNNYIFFIKKNRNSQITNKNEKNETEEKKEMQQFHY